MNRRFEDLWTRAADDGASCPVGVKAGYSDIEVDELLDAWYSERAQRIESVLMLDQPAGSSPGSWPRESCRQGKNGRHGI